MKKQLLNPGIVSLLLLFLSFQREAEKTEADKTPPFTLGTDLTNLNLWCGLNSGTNESVSVRGHSINTLLMELTNSSWHANLNGGTVPDQENSPELCSTNQTVRFNCNFNNYLS